MRLGGKAVGVAAVIIALLVLLISVQYGRQLEQERAQAIARLISQPDYANCRYDASTCPQAEQTVLPDIVVVAVVLLGVLLGAYLIRSDATQRRILDELQSKRQQLAKEERRDLLLGMLTADERRIILAVIEQQGISQATLRLRTDMSKAKLSILLKALEERGLVKRIEDGKTNKVELKREL